MGKTPLDQGRVDGITDLITELREAGVPLLFAKEDKVIFVCAAERRLKITSELGPYSVMWPPKSVSNDASIYKWT